MVSLLGHPTQYASSLSLIKYTGMHIQKQHPTCIDKNELGETAQLCNTKKSDRGKYFHIETAERGFEIKMGYS